MTQKEMEEKIEKMSQSIELMLKVFQVNNAINDTIDKRLDILHEILESHENRIKTLEESQ